VENPGNEENLTIFKTYISTDKNSGNPKTSQAFFATTTQL